MFILLRIIPPLAKDGYLKTELDRYDELPVCENFSVTSGGYEGVWTSIIVKPLAWLIIQLGNLILSFLVW